MDPIQNDNTQVPTDEVVETTPEVVVTEDGIEEVPATETAELETPNEPEA